MAHEMEMTPLICTECAISIPVYGAFLASGELVTYCEFGTEPESFITNGVILCDDCAPNPDEIPAFA